ncbi:bifunctional diaminohydroxyphosphoribosylaminopyrimidine deaminase/5-amino-6-(5-phosphoribosylamino)uracil reductase RibD [Chitinivibrio alkaliphilus]|uniref:Riboflavin biosynthesis protein RibD n=1 Tax=Chitinivibrio alkaliphilus ACht1 TaxID=1313304 RepID=U7D8V9_9BACT|nr:bifunctional diaminohydroxyphosphoribosylaminopyrimidine deaminase/5-amino-6-(5-phosphoribosylamino)uracil reductase RibD [Chitinivibrio alkaliphilus]ERP31542.1 Riboflavin biosynthesis protein ribD [Chitinivibrio alkaliphilus ACht1]
MTDSDYMMCALREAWSVKGFTAPNPAVGAVIVKDGTILARGATAPPGGDHAEVAALAKAGAASHGATMYVTLEPCSHWGRTPPCSDAIIRAGITRVVYAVEDPNPQVSGRGGAQLRAAGIAVTVGVGREEAQRINEDFFYSISSHKPWVSVKLALTLDGAIADSWGVSKWITGTEARQRVHELRGYHRAIAVGAKTLQADNPKLTVRHGGGTDPVRIVFSSTDEIDRASYFYRHSREVQSILVVNNSAYSAGISQKEGIHRWYTGCDDRREGIQRFLSLAWSEGIDSLFVEGGSGLVGSFLEARAVNRVYLFYAPQILGGGQKGLVLPPMPMNESLRLTNVTYTQYGEDLLLSGLLPRT